MKLVILSAFNGRLRSEPMEWPDEPPSIRLAVATNITNNGYLLGKDVLALPDAPPTCKIGVFTHSGMYAVLRGQTAAIYELTNI
jgi:hypothetical protein